jgi:hypothetical protein
MHSTRYYKENRIMNRFNIKESIFSFPVKEALDVFVIMFPLIYLLLFILGLTLFYPIADELPMVDNYLLIHENIYYLIPMLIGFIIFLPTYKLFYYKYIIKFNLLKTIISIVSFPIILLLLFFQMFHMIIKNTGWKFFIIGISLITLFTFGMIQGLNYLISPYPDEEKPFIFLLMRYGFVIVAIIFFVLQRHFEKREDSKNFIEVTKSIGNRINRELLHTILLDNLFNQKFQLRVLNYIDKNRIEVHGEYPDNRFLRVSDSKVNIKLAQLEEKWMGLNR